MSSFIPAHQWKYCGERVRILKRVKDDRSSYGGFLWPASGPVRPERWSRTATCESGGLFGWAWGIGFAEGSRIDYCTDRWIVFEAHPDDTVPLLGKVKAVPNDEEGRTPEVIFCGSLEGAMELILPGQAAWIEHAAGCETTATACGGVAAAISDGNIATATGPCSAAMASTYAGMAVTTNEKSVATAAGFRCTATATGGGSMATATGAQGNAVVSGRHSVALSKGARGVAVAQLESSLASATGVSGLAVSCGDNSVASAMGKGGVAVTTGFVSRVAVGQDGLAVSTSEAVWWVIEDGAVLVQRWPDGCVMLTPKDVDASPGDEVFLVRGKVRDRKPAKREST